MTVNFDAWLRPRDVVHAFDISIAQTFDWLLCIMKSGPKMEHISHASSMSSDFLSPPCIAWCPGQRYSGSFYLGSHYASQRFPRFIHSTLQTMILLSRPISTRLHNHPSDVRELPTLRTLQARLPRRSRLACGRFIVHSNHLLSAQEADNDARGCDLLVYRFVGGDCSL